MTKSITEELARMNKRHARDKETIRLLSELLDQVAEAAGLTEKDRGEPDTLVETIKILAEEARQYKALLVQAEAALRDIRGACINSISAGAPATQVREYAFNTSCKALIALRDAGIGGA